MRIRHLNHSVYQIQYHIVWGTLYRRKVLKYYVRGELIKALYKILRSYPDWYISETNTGDDHVHILIEIPPKYPVSKAVQVLKSHTSVHLKKKFKFINNIYPRGRMWSAGYFVSTVGLNEKNIRRYIEYQSKFDIGKDLNDKFS